MTFHRAVFLAAFAAASTLALPAQQPMAAAHQKPPVPPSTSLTVTFQGKPHTFTLADLRAMPQVTVSVHNVHLNADETYTGPLVADVLTHAGLTASKDTEKLILHTQVIATGTDGYSVLFSAAELEPMFVLGKSIIAIDRDGKPDAGGGNIQIVNADAARPARWVHGLTTLNLVTIAPER
jgi:hypothetical protein